MIGKSEIINLFSIQKILPLYFHEEEKVSIEVLYTLYKAGISAVEYTNRGVAALQNFRAMRRVCDTELKGMCLGIGTVKNISTAEKFIDAGTDFIICPGVVEEVIEVSCKHELLCIPGCMTPTEIARAESAGVKMVKMFPANILGPEFISVIQPIFPGMLFIPTGGVDLSKEGIQSWFRAGACAVGMGSKLISNSLMNEKNYSKITELILKALAISKG